MEEKNWRSKKIIEHVLQILERKYDFLAKKISFFAKKSYGGSPPQQLIEYTNGYGMVCGVSLGGGLMIDIFFF